MKRLTQPAKTAKTCTHCGAWPALREGRLCENCWSELQELAKEA